MNPQDIAASRFREIRKAEGEIATTEATLAKARERLEELRGRLPQAEAQDRTALAAALVDGKSEPVGKAEEIRAEIVRQEERVESLRIAVDDARREIPRLVEANRGAWRRQATQELDRARGRYEAAIAELQTAREALSSEASLVVWIDGGVGAEAANDALAGRVGIDQSGALPVSFQATLVALRADLDALVAHPTKRDTPEPRIDAARVKVGALLSGWGE